MPRPDGSSLLDRITSLGRLLLILLAIGAGHAGPAARAAEGTDPLQAAPSHFASLDGARIHYKSLGGGKQALLFVHGWTCDMTSWRAQVPAFEGKVRTILVDLPGHGRSDKPRIDYTMDLFARSLDAVLKDAAVEKAVLVGHSMGTPVIRQFYRKYPGRTLALVAVDGALRQVVTDPNQRAQFVSKFEAQDYKETLGKMFDQMVSSGATAEMRDSLKAVSIATPQHVVVGAMKGMLDPSIWKEDPISVPLLVVNTKNPMWSDEYESFVLKIAPKAEIHLLEETGHFLMMEKPAEFNSLLGAFLAKQGLLKG